MLHCVQNAMQKFELTNVDINLVMVDRFVHFLVSLSDDFHDQIIED